MISRTTSAATLRASLTTRSTYSQRRCASIITIPSTYPPGGSLPEGPGDPTAVRTDHLVAGLRTIEAWRRLRQDFTASAPTARVVLFLDDRYRQRDTPSCKGLLTRKPILLDPGQAARHAPSPGLFPPEGHRPPDADSRRSRARRLASDSTHRQQVRLARDLEPVADAEHRQPDPAGRLRRATRSPPRRGRSRRGGLPRCGPSSPRWPA
jgi:hypothetical protein